MSKSHHATRLNMQAFAREGVPLVETIPLQNMERLAQEAQALAPDLMLKWEARAELRPGNPRGSGRLKSRIHPQTP